MPRFHLNIYNDMDTLDEEGDDFADLTAARDAAIAGGRSIMADHVLHGRPVTLCHRIEVTDASGKVLVVLPFRELITIVD